MAFFDSIIFSVEADVANYIAGMQKVNTVSTTTAKNMDQIIRATKKFNDAGKVAAITVTALADDGSKATESFAQTKKGLQRVSETLDNTALAAKRVRQSLFELGKAPTTAIRRLTEVREAFGTGSGADRARLSGALVNAQNEIGKAGVSKDRALEIFAKLKTKTLGDVSEMERGVVKSLSNIINLVQRSKEKFDKLSDSSNIANAKAQAFAESKVLINQLRKDIVPKQLRALLSDAQNAQLNSIFAAAIKPIAEAKISQPRLDNIMQQLRDGTLRISSIKEAEIPAVKALQNIIKTYENLTTTVVKNNAAIQENKNKISSLTDAKFFVNQLKNDLVSPKLRSILSDAQNARLNSVFASAIKPVATSEISQTRLNDLTKALRAGTLDLNTIKTKEEPVVKALSNIINTYNNLTAAVIRNSKALQQNREKLFEVGRVPVDSLRATLLPTGGFKSGTDPALIARFESALNQLQERVGKAGTSAIRLNELYRGLVSGSLPAIKQVERGVVQSLSQVIKAHEDATGAVDRFGTGFLLSWRSIGRLTAIQTLHRLVSELIALFGQARQEAIELAKSINLIQTITLRTAESSDEWFKVIRRISDEFGSDINDTAKAAYEAIGNQITETSEDTEKFVTQVLRLSRVTQSTARDAGATLAGLLNAYQLSASQTERVSGILFKAVDLGSFTLNDVADRLGRLAPLANQLGVSIEEMSGAIAALSNEGRRADATITILRAIIQKLLKPTEATEQFFKKLGFTSSRAAFQLLGFTGVVKEFSKVMQTEGVEALVKYFDELRGLEAGVSLTATAFERVGKFIEEIRKDSEKDFFKANIVTAEDAIRKLTFEFNRFKNVLISFSRDFLKIFSDFNDSVDGLTNRFATLILFVKNTATVQAIGALTTIVGYIFKTKSAIDALSLTLTAAADAFIVFRTASLFLAKGNPIIGLLTAAAVAIDVIVSRLEQGRLAITESVERFIEVNKSLLNDLAEVDKANTAQFYENTRTKIQSSKVLILGYLNNLALLAEKEKDLLKETAQDVEANIESSLKNRVERFKEYIKAIDREITSLSEKIEKNLKEIDDIRSKANLRNFEATLKGKNPAEQFNSILDRVKQLEFALQEAVDPEKFKSIFEEADKLLEDATKNQEKRLEEAERKGKLSTAAEAIKQLTALEGLRNTLKDEYLDKLREENLILGSQAKDLEKQKEISAQLFGELKAITREGLKVKIFDRETGDLNDINETIRKMTSVIERLDSITNQLPDLGVGDFRELSDLKASLLKDVNELGIRENVVKTFADSVNKLASELRTIETKIPENIRKSLDSLGIQGNNINQIKVNAENLFKTVSREFENTLTALQDARAERITDSAVLQGFKNGLSGKGAAGLAKLIPTDAKDIDSVKKLITILKDEAIISDTGNVSNAVRELIEKTLPKIEDIVDRAKKIQDLEKTLEEFRLSIEKFGTVNDQIISTNVKLETKLDLTASALDRNTLAITQLSANLLGSGIDIKPNNQQGAGVNLGGVTVNVNGAPAPQLVANEVVKQINLQIRRGNVKIGEKNV